MMTETIIVPPATRKIATNATETKTEKEIMNEDTENENQKMALIIEVHIVSPAVEIMVDEEEPILHLQVVITVEKIILLPGTKTHDMMLVEGQIDMKARDMKIVDGNVVHLRNDVVLRLI